MKPGGGVHAPGIRIDIGRAPGAMSYICGAQELHHPVALTSFPGKS